MIKCVIQHERDDEPTYIVERGPYDNDTVVEFFPSISVETRKRIAKVVQAMLEDDLVAYEVGVQCNIIQDRFNSV